MIPKFAIVALIFPARLAVSPIFNCHHGSSSNLHLYQLALFHILLLHAFTLSDSPEFRFCFGWFNIEQSCRIFI
jgi:hypothetical protein